MARHRRRQGDHNVRPGDIHRIVGGSSRQPLDHWVRFEARPFAGGTLIAPKIIAPCPPPRRAMLRRGKGRRR